MKHLAPDYVYTPQGLQSNRIVSISDDGYIYAVNEREPETEITETLPGVALLPGFVNTHSHAFQRALRGCTHHARSTRDTFWTWRQAMYTEAQHLNPDSLYQISLQTYREMLAAGYTSVGEFHYVHHQPDGQPYAQENIMSEAVLQAGREAGIRVVLLLTAYARGGFYQHQPLDAMQRRFCDASLDAYLSRADALRTTGIALGVAPHSVRAVPEEWLSALAAYSLGHQLPFHIHADEQVAEIEQCLQAHNCTPIALLERNGALGSRTTVIHATHASQEEIALLARYKVGVCVCPTTEGDLGDGIAPYAELVAAQVPLCIGSDSNTRLDPLEELRWAEYSARMRYQRRRILVPDELAAPGPLLLTYGTQAGAAALGLLTGSIEPGMAADFVAVDLHAPSLTNWTPDDFLDTLFFGASSQVFTQTWVQGHKVWSATV
jgi:formimidoylglutamate deiminase